MKASIMYDTGICPYMPLIDKWQGSMYMYLSIQGHFLTKCFPAFRQKKLIRLFVDTRSSEPERLARNKPRLDCTNFGGLEQTPAALESWK